jgi:NAD dependent epimerase/dehydratase family enzyme
MKNKKIVIAGGSGFIGQAIACFFGKENEIIILGRSVKDHENNLYGARRAEPATGSIKQVTWDAKTVGEWVRQLENADIVINLAGKSVNCRYHAKQKRKIINSRINATKAIGQAIRQCIHPPKLWVNAASATIYRHSIDHPQDEYNGVISEKKKDNMPWSFIDQLRSQKNKFIASLLYGKKSQQYKNLDLDFSVLVCKEWEKAFFEQRSPFTRKVALRTAITLGKGGVITPYLNLCKCGLGGKHGNGQQMFSWVHIDDVCRFIEWLYYNKEVEGIYNCVAPHAVNNSYLMQVLRKAIGKKIGLPTPSWLLELGAWIIGTETELMLKSRWVYPKRSQDDGFVYKYARIEQAIDEIVKA